jgi:hypothetical protein
MYVRSIIIISIMRYVKLLQYEGVHVGRGCVYIFSF